MGIRSTFLSRIRRTGRDEVALVEVDGRLPELENKLSFEFKMWSRSLRSSFADIISAAAPLGHRIMGMTPVTISFKLCSWKSAHTHSNNDAEQAAHNPLYYIFQLLIRRLCAVKRPIGVILAHTQTEQIRLADNEVQVLIEDLRDVFRRSCFGCLGCEIFEQGAGYRGEEVDVCGGVEAAGQVGCDRLEVGGGGFHQIQNGDIWYGVSW